MQKRRSIPSRSVLAPRSDRDASLGRLICLAPFTVKRKKAQHNASIDDDNDDDEGNSDI